MKALLTSVAMVLSLQPIFAVADTTEHANKGYGDKESIKFARDLWTFMEDERLAGANAISTHPYEGIRPHGGVLELIEVPVRFMGTTGPLIIKRNYGSEDVTVAKVMNNPKQYLKFISVMFKRQPGYDSDNGDWFYANYTSTGELKTSSSGVKMAGRLAKGESSGCIACHASADGGDFIFNHDRYK